MEPQGVQEITLCSQKEFLLKDITEWIISCASEVHKTLGSSLLESVYKEALECEFELRGIHYERQKEIGLKYKGREIGKHRIDYLIENQVIVELKAVESINKIYEFFYRKPGRKIKLGIIRDGYNFSVVIYLSDFNSNKDIFK